MDINEIDKEEDQQSNMAIALLLATEINERCLCIDDVKEVFAGLSEILKIRFRSELRVSIQDARK